MSVTKDLKSFANEHPVVAVVAGGYFALAIALPLFGYSFIVTKVVEYDNSNGINGYNTW